MQVVLVDAEGRFVDSLPSLIEAYESFLWVYFAMEFKHSLSKLGVGDDAAVLIKGEWTRKTRLNVDFASIDTPQQSTNDCGLVIWAPQVVV